jgi:hypothetical protein
VIFGGFSNAFVPNLPSFSCSSQRCCGRGVGIVRGKKPENPGYSLTSRKYLAKRGGLLGVPAVALSARAADAGPGFLAPDAHFLADVGWNSAKPSVTG